MPLDNSIPSYETLLEFQLVWVRAVALSWKDPEFKRALIHDARDALLRYFGYQYPWAANISAYEPQGNFGWDDNARKWTLPNGEITISIPKKPTGDLVQDIPLAIASYNDCGPLYLFTCC
ncbi:BMA_0021/BMA_0022 family TOMM bacteriocin [Massilia sp. W12]|uniref:BMA_0021/BMA_0022 family TOMM bacteriocin n=1 Tax=Massilia sp. W12 TaxID=3126507 RepID=UPI0030D236F8